MATASQVEPKMDCFVTSFLAMTGERQKLDVLPIRTQLFLSLGRSEAIHCRFARGANGNRAA
jgi:hypothetical protein